MSAVEAKRGLEILTPDCALFPPSHYLPITHSPSPSSYRPAPPFTQRLTSNEIPGLYTAAATARIGFGIDRKGHQRLYSTHHCQAWSPAQARPAFPSPSPFPPTPPSSPSRARSHIPAPIPTSLIPSASLSCLVSHHPPPSYHRQQDI